MGERAAVREAGGGSSSAARHLLGAGTDPAWREWRSDKACHKNHSLQTAGGGRTRGIEGCVGEGWGPHSCLSTVGGWRGTRVDTKSNEKKSSRSEAVGADLCDDHSRLPPPHGVPQCSRGRRWKKCQWRVRMAGGRQTKAEI